MTPQKLIIDTDPGIDDVLAISLALGNPTYLDILLLTTTHGNIDVEICCKNVVSILNVMKQENDTRDGLGLPVLHFRKPTVAIGANKPILKTHGHGMLDPDDDMEGYHGVDGLNGYHTRNPSLVPNDILDYFRDTIYDAKDLTFIPSQAPAHVEILNQLRQHDSKTITLVALGPCTNLALALMEDAEAFHRVKNIVIMGGAVRHPGNMTPTAEFNIYGDPDAADVIFNLSSLSQETSLYGRVPVALVTLDTTTYHTLTDTTFNNSMKPYLQENRPLAHLLNDVLLRSFEKIARYSGQPEVGCHDPLTVYAILHPDLMEWETLDIRVETDGKWTRGQTVIDNRGVPRWKPGQKGVIRDCGTWLHGDKGNAVEVLVGSGGEPASFGLKLLESIFGQR